MTFCAIRSLDFRSHLKLHIYFFENDQEHVKMSLFWVGDEIIFLCPVKRAVEKKAVFSNIYHRTYLLKGSNFLYYTAN